METHPQLKVSGRAKVFASGATALVFAVVGTVFAIVRGLTSPDVLGTDDALGHLVLFIPNFFASWLYIVLILLVHRFFLGFFQRAMPPRRMPMSDDDKTEETQHPPAECLLRDKGKMSKD